MIYIYGDSHASKSFKNLEINHNILSQHSITMFRIGRDNIIINFHKDDIKKDDIIILTYGEVDCRCHIQRQINLGRNEDDIIYELVNNYLETIKNNTIDLDIKIIIVGIIPPTKQTDFEKIKGPIFHEFPFVGNDQDRVRYTNKLNKLLQQLSIVNNYIYFNPYSFYTRPDGTLIHELSDTCINVLIHELSDTELHLGDNSFFLEKFYELYRTILK